MKGACSFDDPFETRGLLQAAFFELPHPLAEDRPFLLDVGAILLACA